MRLLQPVAMGRQPVCCIAHHGQHLPTPCRRRQWCGLCVAGLLVAASSPSLPLGIQSGYVAAAVHAAAHSARRVACPVAERRSERRRLGCRAVNKAGFELGISMPPEEAAKLGIKPFGDGGADNSTSPKPKIYTHGLCASPSAARFVVRCEGWRSMLPDDPQRGELAARVLEVLRAEGFVVLEKLMDPAAVAPLEAEAKWYLDTAHDGFVQQPLRANRSQLHLPYAMPWAGDWLVKHDLVLEIVARYVQNDLAGGRTQEEQQWGLVQWLTSGADLDWFQSPEWGPKHGELWDEPPTGCTDVGNPQERGPWLGRVMVTKAPPGCPPQKHHRDINFPGPTAQLTVQVALTPLVANNGPLGFVPGSHRMATPGYEVVANPPLGSVVLYDSFVEHHGIEHHGPHDRYVMYYEFETRGIFGGYTDEHFGSQAAAHTFAFRMAVDPELRRWVEHVRSPR